MKCSKICHVTVKNKRGNVAPLLFPTQEGSICRDLEATPSNKSLNTSPAETLSTAALEHHPVPSLNSSGTSLSSGPPQAPLSSTRHSEESASSDGLPSSQEMIHLQIPAGRTDKAETEGSAPNPCYLLTPPDTPNIIDHCDLVKPSQHQWGKGGGNTPLWSTSVDANDEGMPMECCFVSLRMISSTNVQFIHRGISV